MMCVDVDVLERRRSTPGYGGGLLYSDSTRLCGYRTSGTSSSDARFLLCGDTYIDQREIIIMIHPADQYIRTYRIMQI